MTAERSPSVAPPEFEVAIDVNRGRYCASIPELSLIESGRDLLAVCERILERAHIMTTVLRDAGFYAPNQRRRPAANS